MSTSQDAGDVKTKTVWWWLGSNQQSRVYLPSVMDPMAMYSPIAITTLITISPINFNLLFILCSNCFSFLILIRCFFKIKTIKSFDIFFQHNCFALSAKTKPVKNFQIFNLCPLQQQTFFLIKTNLELNCLKIVTTNHTLLLCYTFYKLYNVKLYCNQ